MAELLCYEHVNIAYDGALAVRDLSFSLCEGEILGVVGESGSGKTTLLRAAMGLLGTGGAVTGGAITYKGQSLLSLSPRERRRINGPELGMIFQNSGSAFCPIRKVERQLYESAAAHERTSRSAFRARALDLFRRLGLSDAQRVLDSYFFELSGGMQQRVGIAAAMLLHPGVLLCDEPTSALDVAVQKQVVEEMCLVRREFGTAILIVSHNLGVIGAMADRILVMKDGAAVECGAAKQVLEAPRHPYTRALLTAVPRLRR